MNIEEAEKVIEKYLKESDIESEHLMTAFKEICRVAEGLDSIRLHKLNHLLSCIVAAFSIICRTKFLKEQGEL